VSVVVRIPPVLRDEAGGARQIEASGTTLRELLGDLSDRHPALGARVFDEGEIQPFVNVYVDGEDVRTRNGLETPLREGSTVILLPAMAGGGLTPPSARRSRSEPHSAAARRP
jgi:sulfur-carrier protein